MNNAIFITGTDTEVGKTVITGLLARTLSENGVNVITQKWVQTGCSDLSGDIAEHMKFMGSGTESIEKYGQDMVPYTFEFPSSPHLAAFMEKKVIDPKKIEKAFIRLAENFDFVVVEGTGGLMVPINDEVMIVDIVKELDLPVLIVAENRLGAINQTMLTVEALRERGLRITGIVFNRLTGDGDETVLKDNPRIIESLTGIEVLGELGYEKEKDAIIGNWRPIGEKLLKILGKT
ncbi:MAG: dethiobiotin synthase [Candidatus Omnitrophota bacterium]